MTTYDPIDVLTALIHTWMGLYTALENICKYSIVARRAYYLIVDVDDLAMSYGHTDNCGA